MIKNLLEYQEEDAKLKAIEVELSQSEERKKAVAARKFLESVNDLAAKLEQKAGELTKNYKDLCARQNALIESVKDYDSIIEGCQQEDEVAYIQKKAGQLAENIKSMNAELKRLEETVKDMVDKYNALKKKTSDAKKQYVEYGQKYNALKEEKRAEMKKLEDNLANMSKNLDPKLFEAYLQRRKDKNFPIVFPLKEGKCSHCGMELSMMQMENVRKNKIIECDNCRCLVYFSEN